MDADGFFHCGHCHRVVTPTNREIEAAELAPEGRLAGLKCPRCHRRAVDWRMKSPARAMSPELISVTQERGQAWFALIKNSLNL